MIRLLLIITIISTSAIYANTEDKTKYELHLLTAILEEVGSEKYEAPFKAWLQKNRKLQYAKFFGEVEEPKKEDKDDGNLFTALAELQSAVNDPQVALLDYYINTKCEKGWEVVSLTRTAILLRRVETK